MLHKLRLDRQKRFVHFHSFFQILLILENLRRSEKSLLLLEGNRIRVGQDFLALALCQILPSGVILHTDVRRWLSMVVFNSLWLCLSYSIVLLFFLRKLNRLDVHLKVKLVNVLLFLSRLSSLFLRAMASSFLDDAALATMLGAQALCVWMVFNDLLIPNYLRRDLILQSGLESNNL